MANAATLLALGIPAPILGATIDLAGDITTTATLGGDLTFIADIAGNITATTTLGGDLGFFNELAGDIALQATLGGDLTFTVDLAGSVASAFTLTGDLLTSLSANNVDLAGSIVAAVTPLIGAVTFDVALVPTGINVAPVLVGDLSSIGDFLGDIVANVRLTADLSTDVVLAGTVVTSFALSGNMAGDIFMAGDLTIHVTPLTGDIVGGPLWKPKPDGDSSVWKEAELCNG